MREVRRAAWVLISEVNVDYRLGLSLYSGSRVALLKKCLRQRFKDEARVALIKRSLCQGLILFTLITKLCLLLFALLSKLCLLLG